MATALDAANRTTNLNQSKISLLTAYYVRTFGLLNEIRYAAATGFLDQVRERAGLPLYETANSDPAYFAKHPTLKLAILRERRVELAFANQRWYDLLRFFTTDELVKLFQSKSQADDGIAKLSNFEAKDRCYPIPFGENKLNPEAMYQNSGY